jgi:hypothetical protein
VQIIYLDVVFYTSAGLLPLVVKQITKQTSDVRGLTSVGLSGYTSVYRNIIEPHGTPWNPMELHGIPQKLMESHRTSWNPTEACRIPQNLMESHGTSWNPMEGSGTWRNFLVADK